MSELTRPKLQPETTEELVEIKEEYGYGSLDAAIRHLLRETGRDA